MVVNASINRNSFQRNSLTLCLNVLGKGEQAKANVSRRKELVNIRIRINQGQKNHQEVKETKSTPLKTHDKPTVRPRRREQKLTPLKS